MQTTWMFSVSFFSFYYGIIATPPSDSESIDTAVLNRRTLLKPYLSDYNDNYDDTDTQNSGRRIFNAKLKILVHDGSLVLRNWEGIRIKPLELLKRNDQINQDDNNPIFNIYKAVLYFLLQKIFIWIDNNDSLESIEYYLGLKTETIDLINMSMTELFSRQREYVVKINDLAQIFYFSCDVKNMTKTQQLTNAYALVKDRFSSFLDKFKHLFLTPELLTMEENDFCSIIKYNLHSITEKTNASFGITVSAMKMRMLAYPTDNEQMELLRDGEALKMKKWSVSTYVNSYSTEDREGKINSYHIKTLGIVAMYVFGYVYNHFELLSKLRKYGVDEGADKSVIERFSKYVNAYMSVFVDRYFEFKGEIYQPLVDALFRLIFFLDPSDPQTPDIKDLTEEEMSILNKHIVPEFSMDIYFNNPEENDELDQHMWNLVNDAVKQLIETFTGEDTDSWNNLFKIKYNDSLNKIILLHYMTKNHENAINILEKFASEFTIDTQLYEKYGLNKTSPSPQYVDFPRLYL